MVALLILMVSIAWASDAPKVMRLRTEKVALYDCKDGSKKDEFARKDFQDPWPILAGTAASAANGLLPVQVRGESYCVRAYTVETNKPIAAQSECGAVVGAREPKSAATRGLGEECHRK